MVQRIDSQPIHRLWWLTNLLAAVATGRPNVVAVVACNSSGCSCHTYAYYGGRGGRPIPLSRVAIHNICLVWWPLWLANRLAFGVRGGHTYAQYGGHIYAQCGGRDSPVCVQCGGRGGHIYAQCGGCDGLPILWPWRPGQSGCDYLLELLLGPKKINC